MRRIIALFYLVCRSIRVYVASFPPIIIELAWAQSFDEIDAAALPAMIDSFHEIGETLALPWHPPTLL